MLSLKDFTIPALPEKLVSCISYMYKDNFTYDTLVKKISSDIGLAEKVLTTANSQYYSRGAEPTYNLKQSIIRIGEKNLLKILTDEYYKNTFKNIDVDFFTLYSFNRHSNYVSHLAVSLGEYLNVEDTNDLMIAGLFHDVGHLVRSHCQKDIMEKLVNKCKVDKIDFYSAEKSEVIPTHNSIGKEVSKKWNLSEKVSFLIEQHHSSLEMQTTDSKYSKELDILIFADTIAHSMKFGYDNYHREAKISKQFLNKLDITFETVTKMTKDSLNAVSALAW